MIVCISAEAQDDLLSVWQYSRSHWGLHQADLYLDQLLLRIGWLSSNPGLWQPRPELGKGVHSYPEQRHVIFLREFGQGLVISRVLHQGMEPSQSNI